MTARTDYQNRLTLVKKLTIARNVCIALGSITFISLIGEYVGTRYAWFYALHITIAIFFLVATIGLEWFIKTFIIHNGDIEFQPIFDIYGEELFISYNEFLKQNKLEDSEENFKNYRKVTSCI